MRRTLLELLLVLVLTACTGQASTSPTPQFAAPVPYQVSQSPASTATLVPTLRVAILPTPTTYMVTVVLGDTLSSIAAHAGVTLQALLAANPQVSPTALSVGTKLVIPTGDQILGLATPTPAALPVLQAKCWPESTGGIWCFGLLQNEYAETLENISAQFSLLDAAGQELTSQVGYGLLDILPPGSDLPLAVHFAAPVPMDAPLRVQLLTAIRLLPGDTRYLPVELENTLVSLDASGLTAQVSGLAVLRTSGTAQLLWILASAYDAAGNVIGLRRWDSPGSLAANAPVSFDFQVSSLGPSIARVEFLVEARP